MDTTPSQLWDLIRSGKHVAVIGGDPLEAPGDISVIRVSCVASGRPFAPLYAAQDKIAELLGGESPLWDQAADRVVSGLRRRLLGEFGESNQEASFLASLQRLEQKLGRRAVVLFDAVEAADVDTLQVLRAVVLRGERIPVRLILVFRQAPKPGASQALVDLLQREGAVISFTGPEKAESDVEPAASPFGKLSSNSLRVLRAASLIGETFDATLLARLLEERVLHVLEQLQEARDLGVPLADSGDGHFHLPESVLVPLREGLLPSLAAAWRRRLLDLLGESQPAQVAPEAPSKTEAAPVEAAPVEAAPAEPAPAVDVSPEPAPPQPAPPETAPTPVLQAGPLHWPYGDLFAASPQATQAQAQEVPQAPAYRTAKPSVVRRSRGRRQNQVPQAPMPPSAPPQQAQAAPQQSAAQAASQHAALGELEEGAERYLRAAQEAEKVGATHQAAAYAAQALRLLSELPESPSRRLLRIRALTALAREQWEGSGEGFTLAGALEAASQARALLEKGDPSSIVHDVVTVLAGIYYDLGDLPSLERALAELTTASRELQLGGDGLVAARLLNDQAAVYIRIGDPVRAAHLLDESRKLFERRIAEDPLARRELADTLHLLARLPLHVASRPGREVDAIEMGRHYAHSAESLYREMRDLRGEARVLETKARLELKAGRIPRALSHLQRAIAAQEHCGDLIGLARSTATMADVFAKGGEIKTALQVLAESITLNLEKGTPLGLSFNRQALERLAGAAEEQDLGALYADVTNKLHKAETLLGRARLPSDQDLP